MTLTSLNHIIIIIIMHSHGTNLFEFQDKPYPPKATVLGLSITKYSAIIASVILTQYTITDRQMYRWTNVSTKAITALA